MGKLSHVDEKGRARMVDVTAKKTTVREAVAAGTVQMMASTLALIQNGGVPKGDVLAVARLAGIMAAKKTSDLIPLCHPLPLTGVEVQFDSDAERGEIAITATVRNVGQTGVEMEALTAVSIAALTIYDMCKAVDRLMTLTDIRLLSKRGGKSGEFIRTK
jgi:cyclic pyranopterin phosphate synthase